MKKKLLTTRSKSARKLADEALARMAVRPETSIISTSSIRGKKRDPNFLSTSMIQPEIRAALDQEEAQDE